MRGVYWGGGYGLARAIAGDERAGVRAGAGSAGVVADGASADDRVDADAQSSSWQRRFEPYLIPEWSGVDRTPVRATVGKTMFASIMRGLAADRNASGGTVRARIEPLVPNVYAARCSADYRASEYLQCSACALSTRIARICFPDGHSTT